MTKQLYEEALADVKKLKEVAEDNAKKALIEAVAPRIKDLIEAELLREAEENPVDDGLLLDDELSLSDGSEMSIGGGAQSMLGATQPDVTSAISMPDEEGKVTLDLDALTVEPEGEEQFMMSAESTNTLLPLVDKVNEAARRKFESKLSNLNENVKNVLGAGKNVRKLPGYSKLVSEMVSDVEKLYQYLQESINDAKSKVRYEDVLEKLYKDLNRLTEQNMNNKKSLTEAELSLKLTGIPDELADSLDDIGVELISGGEEDLEGGDEGEEGGDEELDLDSEEEDEEGSDEELDLGGEDEEEEKKEEGVAMESRRLSDNTIVEIDENMLRREISRMKALREAAEDVQTWGHGAGEVSDDFEDEDMGDPFLDVDLTTEGEEEDEDKKEMDEADDMEEADQVDEADDMEEAYQADEADDMDELDQMMKQGQEEDEGKKEMDELEQGMDELDQAEDDESMGGRGGRPAEQSQKQSRQPGKTVESVQLRLAAEKKLQVEAKKKAQAAKQKQNEAQKKAQQKQKEAKQKQMEAQKKAKQKQMKEAQKAKADAQKAQKEAQQKAKQAKQMKEAYDFFATKFNESVRRTARLQTLLAEVSKRDGSSPNGDQTRMAGDSDNLRKKLAETNLFNMKLLYTNKLLQNESLTRRQKADVIERLDEATTEREVKLVYESLVKTLTNKPNNLAEGTTRVIGSSSAPTRSASTVLNESYEADRWAKLAGIK
jgi:hypothetical protein